MDDLTTVAAVKAFLSLTISTDDALIQTLVTSYSQAARSFTSRDFTVETYDLWRSGRGQSFILVPQEPIATINTFQMDGLDVPVSPDFSTPGYRITPREIILQGGMIFPVGRNNIYVNYTAGAVDIPADVTEAVTEWAAYRYKLKGDNLAWSSKVLANENVTLMQRDMPPAVKTILMQYQNRPPI